MKKYIKFIFVFIILLMAAIVGLQLADPFTTSKEAPQIHLSDSNEEIVYTAMNRTGTADYTVEAYRDQTTNETSRDLSPQFNHWAKHENSEQRLLASYPDDYETRYTYENEYFVWRASEKNSTVERESNPSPVQPRYPGVEMVHGCDCIHVQTSNKSTLVLVINDTATALEARYGSVDSVERYNATVTLYIDRQEAELRKTVFYMAYTGTDKTLREEKQVEVYTDWDDTEVERPDWAYFSIEEFVYRIIN